MYYLNQQLYFGQAKTYVRFYKNVENKKLTGGFLKAT